MRILDACTHNAAVWSAVAAFICHGWSEKHRWHSKGGVQDDFSAVTTVKVEVSEMRSEACKSALKVGELREKSKQNTN